MNSKVVAGKVSAPASKSESQRALFAALLAEGENRIRNLSNCDDVIACRKVIEHFGARYSRDRGGIRIIGAGREFAQRLRGQKLFVNCGESGLCLRMTCALAASVAGEVHVDARGTLLLRPAAFMEPALKQLGCKFATSGGFPPMIIQGNPEFSSRGELELQVDGSDSSQFLSGLLFAMPCRLSDTRITVNNLKSKPYIELSLSVLRAFQVQVEVNSDYSEFYVPGGQSFTASDYCVSGDWSGAAFLLVAGAIAGEVTVSGLDFKSSQADQAVLAALERCGARVMLEPDNDGTMGSVTTGKRDMQAFEFDATDCPDLFPPLAVLACACTGQSRIWGVSRLIHKESNRAAALMAEFSKLGCLIDCRGDVMLIEGRPLKGSRVKSHGDHRIAMALGVAGLIADGPVEIENKAVVSKSFPEFFEVLGSLCQS